MTLNLTESKVQTLRRALDQFLEQLTLEAARTERREFAHELWTQKAELEQIRQRLGRAEAYASAAQP